MGSKFSRRRLILSALLGITIILVAYSATLPTTHQARATNSDELLKTLASRDSDNDGLLDWEETLYKTDPQNPHSVQADLLDGEALAQGLISLTAPEPTATNVSGEDTSSEVAPGSITDQFTNTFFAHFSSDLQNGSISNENKESAVEDLVQLIQNTSTQLIKSRYTLSSLSVQPGTSIDEYVSNVESIVLQPDEKGEESIMYLINAVIEDGSFEAKQRLGDLVKFYGTIAKDLAATPVSPDLANTHLKLVQSLDIASLAMAAIVNIDADPLVALASISAFNTGPKMTVEALQEIMSTLVRARGTPLNRNLPGYRIREALNP